MGSVDDKDDKWVYGPEGRKWCSDSHTINGKFYPSEWYSSYSKHPSPVLLWIDRAKKKWIPFGLIIKGKDMDSGYFDPKDEAVEKYDKVVAWLERDEGVRSLFMDGQLTCQDIVELTEREEEYLKNGETVGLFYE